MDLVTIFTCFAGILLFYAAWVDWHTYRVPYITIFGVAGLGVAYSYAMGASLSEVILVAIAVGFGLWLLSRVLELLLKKPVLGYGDIQLFVACLLWIKLEDLPLFFIVTGAAGAVLELFFMRGKYIPLVPMISLAWLFVILL